MTRIIIIIFIIFVFWPLGLWGCGDTPRSLLQWTARLSRQTEDQQVRVGQDPQDLVQAQQLLHQNKARRGTRQFNIDVLLLLILGCSLGNPPLNYNSSVYFYDESSALYTNSGSEHLNPLSELAPHPRPPPHQKRHPYYCVYFFIYVFLFYFIFLCFLLKNIGFQHNIW